MRDGSPRSAAPAPDPAKARVTIAADALRPLPAPPSLASAAIRTRAADDRDEGWLSGLAGCRRRRQPGLSLRRRGPRQAWVAATTAIPASASPSQGQAPSFHPPLSAGSLAGAVCPLL